MMTPQEVASHAFAKATIGGYNMAMVDEFLDALTDDYTALYNDNAILKNKLKVLSDTVEEYRATDKAMRKTLLAAQQMADTIVAEAEQKKTSLVKDAESSAAGRIAELNKAVAAEELRLKKAQEATAAYIQNLKKAHEAELKLLDDLALFVPEEDKQAAAAEDISASLAGILAANETEADGNDEDATRRFDDLKQAEDVVIE